MIYLPLFLGMLSSYYSSILFYSYFNTEYLGEDSEEFPEETKPFFALLFFINFFVYLYCCLPFCISISQALFPFSFYFIWRALFLFRSDTMNIFIHPEGVYSPSNHFMVFSIYVFLFIRLYTFWFIT